MATNKAKKLWPLNEEINLLEMLEGELTVRLLKTVLNYFPDEAKIRLQNFSRGTILPGFTALTGVNAKDTDRRDGTTLFNDDGEINTLVFGYWDEGNLEIKYGPKQEAEINAAVAEMTK